ncbi:putative ankyrin repeat-containing domain, PGG domain, protein accelerated cell death 6 [Rosa chinensis]|uniref:Putative ankyrin repeat-containing domain, PGG domain, protein accelerated cell death 6 n=1 Tax=Rosa chinensis TaxID=74649 RepID=A0A2P6RL99_ROSCH|nr:putative ankyrin repeat-containing domain, PGG domain, protein accelerated cell death 6 [Rosa chinensis]
MDQPSTSSDNESGEATQLEIEKDRAIAAKAESSQEVEAQDECLTGMDLPAYRAATTGNIDFLVLHGEHLSQILTPTKNTVLHIYIACAKRSRTSSKNTASINTVTRILDMCPGLLLQANERGDTTLHVAAKHGHDHIVEHLIKLARARQEEACCQLLIRTVNHDGDTALHEAVRFNHLTVVEILTRADPEALYSANDAGETPLYMAAQRGYNSLVSEILETCTNPSYEGPDGRTALHASVIYNDRDLTSKLLDYFTGDKALTKAVDKQGWTPLHFAAFFGHSLIVKHLLRADESAAYVRDKDDKKTALHIAVSKGHLDVMKELISHCPDCCELVDKRHQNVLHYAIENKRFEIQDFVQKDPWLSNVLLNGKDDNQNTPFHQLAASFYKFGHVSRAGSEIIDSSKDFISDARVDKMAFNKEHLTALDMIQANHSFSRLEKKYVQRLSSKVNSGRPGYHTVNDEIKGNKDKEIKIERKEATNQIVKELKQSHLIAATLIATVTFTAGMTMPGGYQSQKGRDQGFAVLTKNANFRVFILTNLIAMTLSSLAVFIHILVLLTAKQYTPFVQIRWVLHLTVWALIFMMVAFYNGTAAVLRDSLVATIAISIMSNMLVLVIMPFALFLNISTLNSTDAFYMFLVNIRVPTVFRFCMFHLRCAKNKIRSP